MLYESGRSGPWPGHDTETISGTMYTRVACSLYYVFITIGTYVYVRMCIHAHTTLAFPVAYAAVKCLTMLLYFLLHCS